MATINARLIFWGGKMGCWNYRIAKQTWPALQINSKLRRPKGHQYVIVEAFYNNKKKVDNWTCEEIAPCSETIDGLIEILEYMLNDAKKCRTMKPLEIRYTR